MSGYKSDSIILKHTKYSQINYLKVFLGVKKILENFQTNKNHILEIMDPRIIQSWPKYTHEPMVSLRIGFVKGNSRIKIKQHSNNIEFLTNRAVSNGFRCNYVHYKTFNLLIDKLKEINMFERRLRPRYQIKKYT